MWLAFQIGALSYCLERGWAIPARVAIAGFGSFEISACCVPSISTLAVSGAEIGERTAGLILTLVARARDKQPRLAPVTVRVVAKPVLRASTVR
jgi:LacI family transcriptional regulator, gluconate utilization system Gnt-I transcriptional repressor